MFGHLKLALRLLAKSRGFSALAIVTLAVTIGVNSAIFSLIDGALLRPVAPYHAKEIVCIFNASRDAQRSFRPFSYAEFLALREPNVAFADVAAVNFNYVSLGREMGLRRSFAFMVSDNYFALMGAQPVAGRFFTAAEARPNAGEHVVVASYNLWQKNGARADFVGNTLFINGQPHTVIGVSPEGFSGVSALVAPEVWLPFGLFAETTTAFGEVSASRNLADAANYCVNLMARLHSGLTIKTAQSKLAPLAARLQALDLARETNARELVIAKPFGINTKPGDAGPLRLVGALLFSMSAVVLLIGCLNLANMMLARGSARAPEIAVRLALGATRGQIVRQLVAEGVVLALIGGTFGLLLSVWANAFLQRFFEAQFATFDITLNAQLHPDFLVVAATFAMCLVATLLFSLGPALRAARPDLVHDLKSQPGDARASVGWSFFSGRHVMVMAQIALCLAMLFSAGLFLRAATKQADFGNATGFSSAGVAIAELDFSLARTPQPEALRRAFASIETLRRSPGVEAAALTSLVPYNSSIVTRRVVRSDVPLENARDKSSGAAIAIHSAISAGYFDALGLRILRGRDFRETETRTPGANRLCIVDEGLAQKLFPGEDALGRSVRYSDAVGGAMEIIGVVNRHAHGMEDGAKPAPNIFVPLAQEFAPMLFVTVRSAAKNHAALLQAIGTYRRELQVLDPELPVLQMLTFPAFVQKNFTMRMVELGAIIFGVFAGVALLLASVGVYGVKAYAVERRTREIGIRIALGADRHDVFALVMKQGAQQTLVALAVGAALSFVIGRALAATFFQVRASDPLALAFSAAVLICATMLACFLPARRATQVSPLRALRSD